ncbi:MAG TPA: ABC transporter permease [Planctomycetaceae bacterium]|nr:ABC transporter permease [Planctomycetaceae bacterium]
MIDRPSQLNAVVALTKRELIRFLRQRTRVIGAVGQPVIFWILFGAGLRSSFNAPSWADSLSHAVSYQEYFLPGVAVLIVLFTAIFSTISIIEDRREGFLQGILVAPVSRLSIVLSKLVAGTILAILQAGLFLIIGPLISAVGIGSPMEVTWSVTRMLMASGFLVLIAAELTALGFIIAWPMNSTQGFHAVMSIFLMPMWLVSGALFPGGDSGWLFWLIRTNPLTYGVAGLRRMLYEETLPVTPELPSMAACVAVTVAATVSFTALSAWLVSRSSVRNTA